jgi:hypothetical protein
MENETMNPIENENENNPLIPFKSNRSGNPWVRPFLLSDLENRNENEWAYEKLDITFKHVLGASGGDCKVIQAFINDYCKKYRPAKAKREIEEIEREKKLKAKLLLEQLKNSGLSLEDLASLQ